MRESANFIPCTIKQLESDRQIVAATRAVEINPLNRPLVLNRIESIGVDLSDREFIAVLTDRKWRTQGVHLSVSFLDSPPTALRTSILGHMNAWGESGNISFRETNGTGQVRIARALDGHWSNLGTEILEVAVDKPTMNLQEFTTSTNEAELRRVVRHETGHTLGFPHEHLRREFVGRLIAQRVIDYFAAKYGWSADQTRRQVLTPLQDALIVGTPNADEDLIMCYELPGTLTTDGRPIRGGDDINARDAAFAAACYPMPQADRIMARAREA